MAARQCAGIKTDGIRCGINAIVGETRCRTHLNTIQNNGPNTSALKELGYTHKKALKDLSIAWRDRIAGEQNVLLHPVLRREFEREDEMLRNHQRNQYLLLDREQQERIRQTGIDPDAAAQQRRQQQIEDRRRNALARLELIRNQEENEANRHAPLDAEQVLRNRILQRNHEQRELQQFATDNQNIHTVRAVNMTKEMVATILTIPVPEQYKWNSQECSKTPGEIVMMCRLTPRAAWQMVSKYCQDESIYELGKGIYGKVLDGVWQYVLSSPDKADLCRVLKQEMEDNIGMCAQGNLSRLCNILAGYMEGIGSQESIADVLGRLMPRLMEIEDITTRFNEALKILKDNRVPLSQWKSWVDPLMFDQDVEMTVGFIRNERDEVVGFVAVSI
jgi:hypothetical protein